MITNIHIEQALVYSRQLVVLADQGDSASLDDGCRLLFGVIRDCGYKIKKQAERELQQHKLLHPGGETVESRTWSNI
jgi:hypothetical protein